MGWIPGQLTRLNIAPCQDRAHEGQVPESRIALGVDLQRSPRSWDDKARYRDRSTGLRRGIVRMDDDLIGRRGSSDRDPVPVSHEGAGHVSPIAPWPGCQ